MCLSKLLPVLGCLKVSGLGFLTTFHYCEVSGGNVEGF